jgi:hypothetical protein
MTHRLLPALGLAVAVCVIAGCGGSSGGGRAAGTSAPTSASTSVSTSVSTSPAPADPSTQLAAIARKAAGASYSASYAVTSSASGAPRRVEVAVTPTASRIVLAVGTGRVLYLSNPRGQYACRLPATGAPACYRLGATGQRLVGVLDPGIAHLFADYPRALASGAGGYDVAPAPPVTTAAGSSACYAVSGGPSPAAGSVSAGTYCWSRAGVLTSATFASGQLRLTTVGPPPPASELTPPASPTPLPTP